MMLPRLSFQIPLSPPQDVTDFPRHCQRQPALDAGGSSGEHFVSTATNNAPRCGGLSGCPCQPHWTVRTRV